MRENIKKLFLRTDNVERASYTWNAIAGIAFAMQSAVLLIVIGRTNGVDDAGIFSIAYAIASLMSFLGEYGVRKYQIADVNEVNSFADYYSFRLISCTVMIIACVLYAGMGLVFKGYSMNKFLVIMMVSVVKLVEAFVDVFYGRFQQKWRLDVAAKTNCFRIFFGMICCSVSLIVTHDLLISCIVWAVAVIVGMYMSTLMVHRDFCTLEVRFDKKAIKRIAIDCFPLFIGSFLLIYVGNAPKYAIDACMDDASQARFNYIFMPVFVISMLANFVFNPIIVKIASQWNDRHFHTFNRMVRRQILVIVGITLLAIAVALTIGCPVLGWLYNEDLSGFKTQLVILMIGGGMLALVNFFTIVVTIIKYQRKLTFGYVAIALMAWAMSRPVVENYGIMGASLMYTILMTTLAAVFAGVLLVCERSGREKIC